MELVRCALAAIDTRSTASQAAKLMGGRLSATEAKRSWDVAVSDPGIRVTVSINDGEIEIDEIDINVDVATGLHLSDLAEQLGPYKKVFESKTSSVHFLTPPGEHVTVYADLLSSKISPGAAVSSVTLRR